MSDSNSIESGGPPAVEVDVQDPLPESNFFWRRIFAYVLSSLLLGLLAYVVFKMTQPESLRTAALYLSILLWFSMTYYMIAPSAEQVTRIIQAAKILRSGVSMTRRATISEGEAEVETTAGRPMSPQGDAAPSNRRS